MPFEWKDEYSCNITDIGSQHRILLDIGDKLYDLALGIQDSDYYNRIMDALIELKDYTIYHFNYEEQLMNEYGYDKLIEHKFEHMVFINKIENIEKKDIDGRQHDVIEGLILFIADWVTGHILGHDIKFGEYLNKLGRK